MLLTHGTNAGAQQPAVRPDVLFLVVDDMNDWISLLDPAAPIKTPHLERLAARGMLFTKAYCASPSCNPSRTATLTGVRPSTTGVYGNRSDWRRAMPTRPTLMQRFMEAGYDVRGAGKVFHHHLDGAFHDKASFHDFQPMRPQQYPPEKLNWAPEYGSKNTDWGRWPETVEQTIDFQTAEYCVRALQERPLDKPLFLACGIYKPHSPFFAPPAYHVPFETITGPPLPADDMADLPAGARTLLGESDWFWQGLRKLDERRPGAYHDFLRSYAACASLADEQIGRVLTALEKSGRSGRTIIVLWSDHGFHLGEKEHLEKFALWEKTTHVPFIVVAPGVAAPGGRCHAPVDLMTIYPTLLELCGLPADPECEGVSLTSLLRDPDAEWERPALMTYGRGNHAVRSRDWRYIRYADGTEELYDHRHDPQEWNNIAADGKFAPILAEHRAWLPKQDAPPIADLKPAKGRKGQ
ncbi:Choline-sulfatase [Caulifigura coniformis]|uniref:Choline-sulfatase n=1 Tax=Caulifigura coniformis TaxID=2527983 RepID=A0A517S9D0_9PLAN|nr:sulfatase [Caulifigura coniformis]QDT52734.1 Choline-sulfatase [Caulifigura coniformis]